MSDLTTLRESIATALEATGRVTYSFPKEQIVFPAIVVVPGSPYIEPDQSFGGRYQVNFDITACVAVPDNQTALMNLEALMLSVMSLLPTTVNKMQWTTPSITEVGAQNALTSVLTIQAFATI